MVRRSNPDTARFSAAPPNGPLDDEEVAAFLHAKINDAINRDSDETSRRRQNVLSRYRGDNPVDEGADRSSYVSRELFEMVEDSLPGLLSIFLSARHPVLFQARGPKDVAAATHETAIIDHYLFRRSSSFMTFHSFFKSALLDMNAYVKVHCRHQADTVHHRYAELLPPQFQALMTEDRVWKTGVKVEEVSFDPVTYAFEGTEIVKRPEFLVEPVPPEQLLVDRDASHVDLDDVWERYGFIGHATEETHTELVRRGYGKDELEEAGGDDAEIRFNDERVHRRDTTDESPRAPVTDYSTKRYLVYECYVKADFDGSGVADSWRVVLIGNKVFEKDRVSYQPFVSMSAIPMPFKHIGTSPGEALLELQHLQTKLTRVMLNDFYRNEVGRVYADKNAMTDETVGQIADRSQALIKTKGPPAQAVMPEPRFSIAQETLAALQYGAELAKKRTGIAPDVAMNPDVLRDATAHGMLASLDKSSNRLMSVARVFAETGVKKIGVKLHQLLRMYQDHETFIEIQDQWVPVNPADWDERTEMKVSVGLGFNSKADVLQALAQILMLQKEALPQGLAQPKHIKHTLSRLIEDGDLGFYDQFFDDPERPGWQPPPPPPNPQVEAVKAQMEAVKLQEQTKQADIQARSAEGAAKAQLEREKIEVDRGRIAADAATRSVEVTAATVLVEETRALELEKLRLEIVGLAKEHERVEAEIEKLKADAEAVRNPPEPAETETGDR